MCVSDDDEQHFIEEIDRCVDTCRAVARNYIKRTIREIFRREQHRLGSFDLVVRSRECFGRTERADVDTALTALLLKLAPCPASSSSLSASTS